jgi:alkylated DNA repair dioxygenase AlkB
MASLSTNAPAQAELFAERQSFAIPGFEYQTDFLSSQEEESLLLAIRTLDLQPAQYRQWRANRRTASFGGQYDFTAQELVSAAPIPPFLFDLRARIASCSGIEALLFNHAIVAEYRAGTQLGWHRDVPHFQTVVGVSLAASARLRFRPYPPRTQQDAFSIELAARSIYTLKGAARWDWQHAVSPTKALRYSITFRTLAARPAPRGR